MSWILDIIIVAIIGLTIFFAVKNGFIKTLISTASFAIALVVTIVFVTPLAEVIQKTAVAENIRQTTRNTINEYISEDSLEGVEDLFEGRSEKFNKLLKIAGADRSQLKEWYGENDDSSGGASYKLAKKICDPVIKLISSIIAVIILFLGTRLILSIVAFILKNVVKLPVLKTCDKALGVILGILLALIRVYLFCFVFKVIVQNSMFLSWDVLRSLSAEKTLLFRLFYDFNLFDFLKQIF